ncbi:hypothetical protein ACN4EK_04580 [Pantanalinema rosaneae CENA516]|uniref:hypothetical protein n=1 Tax=Pantanalinema rosaneae TaxID=1620701 RepID=UPI003D6F7B30
MTLHLVRQIHTASDLDPLHELLGQAIGELCWKTSLNYHHEITLHFGEPIAYTCHTQLGKDHGSWILVTRGAVWQLERTGGTTVPGQTGLEDFSQMLTHLEGQSMTAIEITYPDLQVVIDWSNGDRLTLIPTSDDNDLPDWELFTPEQRVLQVGPGVTWSYGQSR